MKNTEVQFRTLRRRCIKAFNKGIAAQHDIAKRHNSQSAAKVSAALLAILGDLRNTKRAKYSRA